MKVQVNKVVGLNRELIRRPLDYFIINKYNSHLFEKVKGVYLRKNRLSTVIHVDSKGIIFKIEGENPKNLKIKDNIYDTG